MLEFLQQPFVMGLCIGLVLAVWVWGNGAMRRRDLRKEVDKMKDHLNTQMEINNRGNNALLEDLEHLREQNEDLRVANSTLKQKPGRQEIQQLHLYDRALRILFQKAPGFAAAWESAITEAEKDLGDTESGLMPFVRKLFTSPLNPSASASAEVLPPPKEVGKPADPVEEVLIYDDASAKPGKDE